MPFEGLGMAEGQSHLQKKVLANCYRQIECEVPAGEPSRSVENTRRTLATVLGERSGLGIGIYLGVCLMAIKELDTRGSKRSHKRGRWSWN